MPNAELDERLMVAMRVARQHHLSYWDAALQKHRGHPTFRMHGWPHTLEYGFTCECSGTEQEFRVSIRHLKEMLPEAREAVIRLYRHHMHRGQKVHRRQWKKADDRARALLHRYLTKEQRWELRKLRAFTMKDKNGRSYRMTLGTAGNVITEHEGVSYKLCVIPKEQIPTHDVLLAQKIMLETEPEAFLRLAVVTSVEPVNGKYICHDTGAFLMGEPVKVKPVQDQVCVIAIPNDVLEDPREWVETRCRD